MPVCQNLPAAPIDAWVVDTFFAALAPVELDAYARAVAAEQAAATQVTSAQRQQLERLRYQAAFAERQFSRVDPENRLVAAELEQRWEGALRALKDAEAQAQQPAAAATALVPLPEELRVALMHLGQQLPTLWRAGQLTRAQQKACLRCLIDKVVLHRSARDRVQARIVWRGGATTTQELPIPVGALADLREGAELEQRVLALTEAGESDDAIATALTAQGYRSPTRAVGYCQVKIGCPGVRYFGHE